MTPDEFDLVYFRLSKALGAASDPVLIRDRLLLLALQEFTTTDAQELIERASQLPPDDELRMVHQLGFVVNRLEHTPGAESRSVAST